ncbi:hypothetical protein Mboo_0198 [Methanoregula boonei 6A8]|uniref:Uncharacterized protein n=1 Tax=Methanoregula boonei (strain DSM 21154 / JCM 14090 / 6A8) TaxID=456442 RepID=A7I4R0_METB6|nr:hypothetical protein Mboo_0198 [Methanoregula boonei 6A8]
MRDEGSGRQHCRQEPSDCCINNNLIGGHAVFGEMTGPDNMVLPPVMGCKQFGRPYRQVCRSPDWPYTSLIGSVHRNGNVLEVLCIISPLVRDLNGPVSGSRHCCSNGKCRSGSRPFRHVTWLSQGNCRRSRPGCAPG